MVYNDRMDKTIFEKIISGEIPAEIVYEDENSFAILDIAPKSLGHTLVIPKSPYRTFLEIPQSKLGQYFTAMQKVAQAVKDGLKADGLNIVFNTEAAAGQEVFHVHAHVIPRYENDRTDMNPGTHQTYSSPDEMKEYAEKIKACLK